jgi:hypothetical protein
MSVIETAYIVTARRGTYATTDVIRSITMTSQRTHCVIVVVDGPAVVLPEDLASVCTVLQRDTTVADTQPPAFQALNYCSQQGLAVHQYMLLDDECLVLGAGVDAWAAEQLCKTHIGVLGVGSVLDYTTNYRLALGTFAELEVPFELYTPSGPTLLDHVLWLSHHFVADLFSRGLFRPDMVLPSNVPYGTLLSWLAQILGYYQLVWGTADVSMPPLFVDDGRQHRQQPAPHILSSQFKLYRSVRRVSGYTEEYLREAYKRQRGEPAKDVTPVRPVLYPRPPALTELG